MKIAKNQSEVMRGVSSNAGQIMINRNHVNALYPIDNISFLFYRLTKMDFATPLNRGFYSSPGPTLIPAVHAAVLGSRMHQTTVINFVEFFYCGIEIHFFIN